MGFQSPELKGLGLWGFRVWGLGFRAFRGLALYGFKNLACLFKHLGKIKRVRVILPQWAGDADMMPMQ